MYIYIHVTTVWLYIKIRKDKLSTRWPIQFFLTFHLPKPNLLFHFTGFCRMNLRVDPEHITLKSGGALVFTKHPKAIPPKKQVNHIFLAGCHPLGLNTMVYLIYSLMGKKWHKAWLEPLEAWAIGSCGWWGFQPRNGMVHTFFCQSPYAFTYIYIHV